MPYSSGTYSLPSGNPVVTGTTISSSTTNTTNSDIATALSTCILKDGTQTITANLPMASHKLTGLSAGTTAGDSVEYGGSPSFTNLAYTGTLTGSTGILNIGSGQVYKDASGNVGIGTTAPNAKLGIYSASANANLTQWFGGTSNPNFITIAKSGISGTTAGTPQFSLGMDYSTTYVDLAAIKFAREVGTGGNMQFFTGVGANGTEQMRIDSSGNVGIGVSNPSTYGILTAYSASNPTLTIASGNANAYLRLNTTSDLNMYLTNTGGSMTMNTANTERMRINSVGNVTLQENISVGGAAPATSGNGITFPATQSASTDPNTLDDYEEGVWTPVLTFATTGTMTYTASSANGSYTKIGNVVTCKVQLILSAFSAGTASGAARISLPFVVGANYHTGIVLSSNMTTLFANSVQSVGSLSYVNLYGNTTINTAPTVLSPTNFTATSNISFSISYTV